MEFDLRLFLTKPDRTEIGEIVEIESASKNIQTSTSDELTVTIPYLVKRENNTNNFISDVGTGNNTEIKDFEYVENPIFKKIREKYLVHVQSDRMNYDKWMIVTNINKSGSSNNKVKEVTLYSKEYELSYEPIIEWAGVFINGEYRKESLQLQSVVNSILDNTTWSIGTVDAQISEYRSFDFSGISKLEALYEIAKKFKAVIIWDTFNNIVNFIHEDNNSVDEGLHISYEKYLDSIDEEINADNIVTRIVPEGYEGITINEYNPTGANYVQNFDFFLYPFEQDENGNVIRSSYWLSDDLCKNLISYSDLIESKTSEYNTLVSERDVLIEDRLDQEEKIQTKQTEINVAENELDLKQSQDEDTQSVLVELDDLEREMADLKSELENIKNQINTKTSEIADISAQLSMDSNFTQSQIDELYTVGKTEDWKNEAINDREELYNEALNELEKRNKPQPVINANLVDLYHIEEAFADLSKIKIGAKVHIEYEFFNINITAQIINIDVDYMSGSIDLTISNIKQIKNDDELLMDTIYSNTSVAGQVLSNKSKWDKVSGLDNTVANFLNSKLDSAKQEIVAGVNETVTINHRGITITDTNDPLRYIRQTNSVIGFTSDGGQTFSTAISPQGIFADKLVGRIIAGQNLTIENTSGTYLINDNGLSAERTDGLVRSFLNGSDGIKIQTRSSASSSWEDKLYADSSGVLRVNDLRINGGTIEWSNIDAPDYSDIRGSKPPSNADVTETKLTSTTVYAPYLEVNSANIQGTLTAQEVRTKSGSTLLSEVSSNSNGGVMYLNDSSGSRNVKIGVEGLDGTNTGGTFILYDDSISKPRVESGVINSNGRINLRDSNGNQRVFLDASSPGLAVMDQYENIVTTISHLEGYINNEKIATQNWVNNNTSTTAKFG